MKATAIDPETIAQSLDLLKALAGDAEAWAALSEEQRIELMQLCGEISRPNRNDVRLRQKQIRKRELRAIAAREREARAQTGIRSARQASVFTAPVRLLAAPKSAGPERPDLKKPRNCYVCKAEFVKLHHFYDSMCIECGDFNYEKRFQRADLTGMTALITGARLKIGYQAALMMLQSGARVIVTTRFPVDAALRFSKEGDFEVWQNRLHIHGLDLRHTPSVEIFCDYFISRYQSLDLLLNNAAQTVRRPPAFYSHLMPAELMQHEALPESARQLLGDFESCKAQLAERQGSLTPTSTALPHCGKTKHPVSASENRQACRRYPITMTSSNPPSHFSRPANSTPICNRLTCAPPIAGG
jgi:hypothetical protein